MNPLKKGAEMVMNRTGMPNMAWPWAHKCVADVNDICATPVLGWKTPIEKRHGFTPDISVFTQFQFWEKVHFKRNESSPNSKEHSGCWVGVSDCVGNAMTFCV